MSIEQQVEQFRDTWNPDPLTDMHGFDNFRKQYYALLRSVVEECGKAVDSGLGGVDEAIRGDIRRHFPWLLEE